METLLNLQFIFRPNYWFQNEKYSEQWDIKLRELLELYNFEYIDEYQSRLGPYVLWTSNRPYRCMIPYKEKGFHVANFRASRLTTYCAIKKYEKDTREASLLAHIKDINNYIQPLE